VASATPAGDGRRRFATWLVVGLVLAASLALVVAVLAPGSIRDRGASDPTGAAQSTPTASPSQPPPPPPIRLVAVGDSITVAGGDIPTGVFTDLSWVRYAVGEPVVPAGGWAVSGATTAQMADGFAPPAGEPYVLVIFGGTNDVSLDLPFAKSAPNLVAIAERAQDAQRVIVTAIPPLTGREAQAAQYNADLAALAAQEGWTFVDPMAPVSVDGRWVDGMTHDGIHPSAAGAQLIGTGIRQALLAP
jgi:lysophospholipase L1-like esterase